MDRSSEDASNALSMDVVPRARSETLALVGSDNSSLTEGDLAILNRLQFLAEKVELLERKLDNTLHNVKGSSDSDLADTFAQDYGVINSFQVNVLTGPSCKQNDYYLDEGEGDSSSLVTRETWENAETEQTTSFLIIPVGNNKEHEVCTLQSENQTLLAPEADLALPECITSDKEECRMIVRPFVATENPDNFNPRLAILGQEEPTATPASAEGGKVFSEIPNQTMFSTASIELATCLPSRSTHPHEQQTEISTFVSEGSGFSLDNLNVSSANTSGNSASPTTERCTYGYTIGLATAKAHTVVGYPSKEPITGSVVPSNHHQHPEKAKSLRREEAEREISRSEVEFTPNSNRNFQYCVARAEVSGRDAITDAGAHSVLSEVKQRETSFADKSINSGFRLSKQRHEADDFIDSSNVREAAHYEKPDWLLDANHNYVQDSTDAARLESDNRQLSCGGRGDAIMNDVDAKGKAEDLITNGSDHYKRSWSNYDRSKSNQIEMQMRYTAAQRIVVACGAIGTQPQAVNHSTNNERSKKFVNNQKMPAVYNGAHCVNNRGSVSEESAVFSGNEESGARDDARVFRDTSPYQRNKRTGFALVNGGANAQQNARNATKTPPPVANRGSPGRKDSNSKSRASQRREAFAAHEHSFEDHLRDLIDPEVIGPAPIHEKPLTPLAHSLAESQGLGQLSIERVRHGVISPTTVQRNTLVEKERSYGSYHVYPTHPTTARTDSSSDSPYSSLTSVSSTLDLGQSAENSTLLFYSGNAVSPYNGRHDERASKSPSVSYISTDFSSATESEAFRSFKLSPLSSSQRAPPPLHCGDLIRNNYEENSCQLSSPTSSLDTSELSVIDSLTECQCQHECACQTGIPSEEDFIEELKTISKSVLNARQKAGAASKTHTRYFLDEEQGEMDIFDRRVCENARRAVPMLVKVILRLRKHFFGTVDSTIPAPAPQSPRAPPKKSSEDGSSKPRRRISFSPSAVLLSAIGENSASEVKEVIEKEKLDVNQLSPSGRSLLHKAAASGDLESIHTLVQHGARVNILDQDGFPPLHSALRKAHYKCAIFLLECGADLNGYTTGRVQEFVDITELAETWLENQDYEQGFHGTMLNTAL